MDFSAEQITGVNLGDGLDVGLLKPYAKLQRLKLKHSDVSTHIAAEMFPELVELTLVDYDEFPAFVSELKKLKKLTIRRTNLKDIPPLPDIRLVSLVVKSAHQLPEIPESVLNMPSLKVLRFANTAINTIPQGIGRLTKLRQLSFERCGVKYIHPEIGKLVNLEELVIMHNPLSEVCEELGQLKKLKTLNLLGTSVPSLPDSLGSLALKTLKVRSTALHDFPMCITNMTQLESLTITGFGAGGFWDSITEIPPEIQNLGCLQHLDVSQTDLKALPPQIGALKNLTVLRFKGCVNITELPEEIRHLSNLKELYFGECSIRELPAFLNRMPKLKKIKFRGCIVKPVERYMLSDGSMISLHDGHIVHSMHSDTMDNQTCDGEQND